MNKNYKITFLITSILTLSIFTGSAQDYTASFFGVKEGGTVLNTRSIQFGIDYISAKGGGTLVFHAGRYLTGGIHLKSGVTLQLDEGAVLLGSTNPFDYERQNTAFDHNFNTSLALILGLNQHNIGITGKGIIDGQGKELAAAVGQMISNGLIKDGGSVSRPDEDNRPMIINLFACDSITVKHITLKNSACWVECYNQCKNVHIDSIRVDSRAFWNNDGIDIVDCENFKVSDSYFNCSDDGICFKSLDAGKLNQNIWIRKNTMTTDASGIKFGTASRGGFKNIHILNNKVFDTKRSAIALEAVDGAIISNIEVDSIQGMNIGNGIFLRAGDRTGTRKGRIENVTINHVNVQIKTEKDPNHVMPAVIIAGMPDQIISNIKLENIFINSQGGASRSLAKISIDDTGTIPEKASSYPEYSMFGELPAWGVYIRHARNIQIKGLKITLAEPDFRTEIVLDDVHQAIFKRLGSSQFEKNKKKIFAIHSSEISSQ